VVGLVKLSLPRAVEGEGQGHLDKGGPYCRRLRRSCLGAAAYLKTRSFYLFGLQAIGIMVQKKPEFFSVFSRKASTGQDHRS